VNPRVNPRAKPMIGFLLGLATLLAAMSGCAAAETEMALTQQVAPERPTAGVLRTTPGREVGATDEALSSRAAEIVLALQERDWGTVARAVHPDKGVRFSPYTFVRAGPGAFEDQDRVFSADELEGLAADPTVYHWGTFDGTGDPIEMTFAEYADRFIYDADFCSAAVGYDETLGRGNTINNVAEVYPQAVTVEYHVEGSDPELVGLDWRSLRLVFEQVGDTWYLVGVVHDEWTI
jgi:hypothetical protein